MPHNYENDEVDNAVDMRLAPGLHIWALHVDSAVHDFHPALRRAHLEKSEQTFTHIIEIRPRIEPVSA